MRLKMLMLDFYNRKIIYTCCGINHGTIIRISQFYGYPYLNLFGYLRGRFSTEIILGKGEWVIRCWRSIKRRIQSMVTYDSGKWRALRALVSHVPRDLRALVLFVPLALRVLVFYMLRTLRALVPHMFYVLLYLTCLVPCAFSYCSCPTCSCAPHSSLASGVSSLTCLYASHAFKIGQKCDYVIYKQSQRYLTNLWPKLLDNSREGLHFPLWNFKKTKFY